MTGTASAAPAGESYAYKTDIGAGESGASTQMLNSVAVSSADGRVFIGRQFDINALGGFEVLNPDGTSLVRLDTGNRTSGIAVTPDGSAVYTLNAYGSATEAPVKYVSDGAPTPTYTQDPTWAPSAPELPTGIAVDPVTGDVLISSDGPIYRFNSTSGALLQTIDGSTIPDGAALTAGRIAVAPNGDIYAVSSDGRVEHMGADGSWKGRLAAGDGQDRVSAPNIAVNPQSGDLGLELQVGYFTPNDTVIQIYSASNDLKETIRVRPDVAAAGQDRGLAFSPDGSKLYIGLTNGTAHMFELGTKPGLDGPMVSQLTPFSFHLTDSVGTGGETTKARFEYCLASEPCEKYLTSEAPSPWHALPDHEGLANPSEEDEIADNLTGLDPLTDYLVRSYAINEVSGVENISSPVAVTTPLSPPAVETGAALADLTTATLNGTINAWGGQTTYHFEYGLTTAYESRVPALVEGAAGRLPKPRTFSRAVSGLQPGTTYHYRLVATNAAGTTAGDDRTFTTLGVDQVAPGRGYEQVTPPNKNGLVPINNFGFQAAPGGGAIEFAASAPSTDSASAPQTSRFIARRGSAGWVGPQPLDPPQRPTSVILHSVTGAVSDDFNHALSVSVVALTPDAVDGAANIYVTDLETGASHLVGTATQPGLIPLLAMAGTKQQNWYMAGAPDFSWVVLISRFPLLPGAPQTAMYKWSKMDGLSVISLLPGDVMPTGSTWQQFAEHRTNRLVSDDGDTVAFSLTSGETGVYRRSDGETVAISESQASGGPVGPQPGTALGMSRDGRFVFLVSDSPLTDDATDMSAIVPTNLYRYDALSGQLTFLSKMEAGDVQVHAISDDGDTVYFNGSISAGNPGLFVWRGGQLDTVSPDGISPQESGPVFASPNGRYLSYSSSGAIHLYDAEAGEETCISCPLTGVAAGGQLPDGERTISNRRQQSVTDDGHAYFGTTQALLPADRNSVNDVYEYYQGRLSLISPGNDNYAALLVDISPDGRDVFFTTSQGLVGQDTDKGYDVYDARIGGGFAAQNPPPPPPPCQGDFCQGAPPPPPVTLVPGSAQSRGNGKANQAKKVRCVKNKRKVRRNGKAVCVKKRNAKHNRGASR